MCKKPFIACGSADKRLFVLGLDKWLFPRKDGPMPALPPQMIPLAANWSSSRDGCAIQCIIAHDTERPSDSVNSIKYLQRGGSAFDGSDRKVSIHGLFEPDGTIYVMVADALAAHHAGFGTVVLDGVTYSPNHKHDVNQVSLGFELEYTKAPYNKPYPEQQLLSMGYWIHQKRLAYGNIPILRHADVDAARRKDTRNLSVEEIEHWVDKAAMQLNDVPTPDHPVMYVFIVPQVVYTDRKLGSRFAGSANAPLVYQAGTKMLVGDITNGWCWLRNGYGFVPQGTMVKV